MRSLFVAVSLCVGCIEPDLVTCGDLTCPVGDVCTPNGCASSGDALACSGLADGTSCTAKPNGFCHGGACRPEVCGDGVIDPGEACDDGNTVSGDGCSAHCDSDETCGNGVVDYQQGEQCDSGVRGLSGDGCSSQCTVEFDDWRASDPIVIPSRAQHAGAFDVDRGRMVIFGGSDGFHALGDTWEWDGANWRPFTTAVAPTARVAAMMSYDPIRHRTVLFGGTTQDQQVAFQDTWEWDGTRWSQRATTSPSGGMGGKAMAFDPACSCTVLFAGHMKGTWKWDGTTWTQVATTGADPDALDSFALAWDPVRGVLVLEGGEGFDDAGGCGSGCGSGGSVGSGAFPIGETWEFDGTHWTFSTEGPAVYGHDIAFDTVRNVMMLAGGFGFGGPSSQSYRRTGTQWTAITGTTTPPGRTYTRVGYDPARDRTILFGGVATQFSPAGDTWEWNGIAWAQRTANTIPTGRMTPIAFDSNRGVAVMFGGSLGNNLAETWEWDGAVWIQRFPTTPPAGRSNPGLVYDEAHQVTLLVGGMMNGGAPAAGTSLWDGTNWTLVANDPGGRIHPVVAYDAARENVVVYGGSGLTDTWTWDGASWTRQTPLTSPPVTPSPAGAYDIARNRLVVYVAHQTWEWDGATWLQITATATPPARDVTTLAYDVLRQRVVMFGGQLTGSIPDFYNDLWEWDGTTWTQRTPLTFPTPRTGSGITYDTLRDQLVMFGGGVGSVYDHDTWRYEYRSGPLPPDQCIAGQDTDGDGLIDCADPDCWGRCTPGCPPGTTCDPALPHCGDGNCSPVESYVSCPEDCTP
jgi:cysteine-rich repeat protein